MTTTIHRDPLIRTRYAELTEAFPLRPIRSDEGLAQARLVLRTITGIERHQDEEDYFTVLCGLIRAYEDLHVELPTLTQGDVLKALLEDREMSQADLSKATGIADSNISAMLHNRRGISKAARASFAQVFGISPTRFVVD